ncbi:MAG: hypothetical protein DLM72_12445 [Candidatus Nitrosopolaris wilkensis]|nr:MAG: hypothetical protein DLM72_12445 [Candidatus Nitrosopolaris wilkensis]
MNGKRQMDFESTTSNTQPINVEITVGHDIGISESYYKPTEHDVLQDYLKAADLLIVNGDTAVLQKQVQQLKENAEDSEYVTIGKLEDKGWKYDR